MSDITQMDLTRAVAVLEAAMKHSMFPEGAMPESDNDKIVEAEKIIALAQQAMVVVEAVGRSNVPNYPAIEAVLFEAHVTMGTNGPPATAEVSEALKQAAAPTPEEIAQREALKAAAEASQEPVANGEPYITFENQSEKNAVVYRHPGCDGKGAMWIVPHDGMDAEPREEVECDQCCTVYPSKPSVQEIERTKDYAPDPQNRPEPEPETQPQQQDFEHVKPEKNEIWADADGGEWLVEVGGDLQCEVQSLTTGESTMVPRGFLRQLVRLNHDPQEEPSPPPSSSPPSSESSPPATSSDSQPEASTTTPSTSPEKSSTEPSPSEPSPSSSAAQSDSSSPRSSASSEAAPADDPQDDEQYADLIERVDRNYTPEAMPVPMDLEHPPSGMPEDLTATTPAQNRQLHSQFNALSARARYLRGLDSAKARECGRLRKLYMKPAMRQAREQLGKSATVTELVQVAEDDENVSKWSEREAFHKDRAEAYGVFFDIYAENTSVLSRDYTMSDSEQRGA